jgi:hypothetical protein
MFLASSEGKKPVGVQRSHINALSVMDAFDKWGRIHLPHCFEMGRLLPVTFLASEGPVLAYSVEKLQIWGTPIFC